jgi:hypothetical protein
LDVKEPPSSLGWIAVGAASVYLTQVKISVKENTALGTVVAKLVIKDPDKNDKITVKLDCTFFAAGTPRCKPQTQVYITFKTEWSNG